MRYIGEIDRWLSENGFDVKAVYDKDESYYDNINGIIHLRMIKPPHMDQYTKYIHKLGIRKELNWLTLTLLHELGHDQTLDYLSGFEYWIDWIRVLTETTNFTSMGMKVKVWLYLHLPIESAATKWSVDYINNNDVGELEKITSKLIDIQ